VVGWLEKNMQKSAECIPHIKLDNEYILMWLLNGLFANNFCWYVIS
jgi:hypothetical protein